MVHDCYYDDDEGREEREREGGRVGGIEAEVWRRVAIAFTFWWFYLVKAAREECHCTSFEKKNHTISRRHLLAEQKQQSFHATSERVRGQL